ncbi:hypothetical protein [Gellertiella hungarica]|uniref:Uncharacterized protein n=1 Tax=Gellertiella hungarica TaxID=1572859 RepID=A0A7W6J7I4_9HYPH|nr:hypothetical protein [Gellertiella hungarica]MBB4066251.1 hypothetical protein [Gellertiella hungarica]
MTRTIALTALATFEFPLDEIAIAIGEELDSARRRQKRQEISLRAATKELFLAVEGVVSALNKLEISTNTPGERAARDRLMRAVSELRTAYAKQRIKSDGRRN